MTCKDCRYCKVTSGTVLTCRKNPPVGKTVEEYPCRYIFKGYWPRVKEDDWCGEFEAQPLTPEQEEGLLMQQLAEEGNFDTLVPMIEDCLNTANAEKKEFGQLEKFKGRIKSNSNALILAASKLAFDAYELRRKRTKNK